MCGNTGFAESVVLIYHRSVMMRLPPGPVCLPGTYLSAHLSGTQEHVPGESEHFGCAVHCVMRLIDLRRRGRRSVCSPEGETENCPLPLRCVIDDLGDKGAHSDLIHIS